MSWGDELEWDDDQVDYPNELDETFTVTCSNCKEEVYEDADVCPYCGAFVVADTHAFRHRPTWFIGLGLLGIIAVILSLSGLLYFL